MVWKTVNNSDAGTATKHGGNDIDKIASSFNGNNVSDPIIFKTDLNTLRHGTTNAAGDLLKGNGTKFDRFAKGTALQVLRVNSGATDLEWAAPGAITTREDLACFVSMARKTDIGSTYADLEFLTLSSTGTQHVAGGAVYITDIDFTGKTQFKAQWIHGRNGTGTQDVRVVESGTPTNVLFTSTGHTSDGRKTVALTSLPGWATGTKSLRIQAQSTVTTDDASVVDMAIYLK